MLKKLTRYERANAMSHALGILFGIVAIPLITRAAWQTGRTDLLIAVLVYGISFMMVFTFSTLYHAWIDPVIKRRLLIMDFISIYYLIAGSYTPFLMVYMNEPKGWALLVFLWSLAIMGTWFKIKYKDRFATFSLMVYLLMGWIGLFWSDELFSDMSTPSFQLLIAGGLAYTFGVIFFVVRSIPGHHLLWHLSVLLGAVLHFVSALLTIRSMS